ncbi:PREDICTED: heterogeneous nuclear ribonucleoprotein C-like isoform X2 [Chinchilla lanigera]|uniref:heterogeneous nuclear ribonucleoprotein C-like isoform X2 n=1 Tax=Chinchilla lanigera TaxID=34839 RepID=UPI00038EDF70|nr:PREDICTED: heterogeneous nuclear ribonucleoprotein C-like isoform X2 [Chinchilla lanigera]
MKQELFDLDMAGEARPGPGRPGHMRQQDTAGFRSSSSKYDLHYELHREDVPYRVYGYQRVPPLINQVPAKLRRTFLGLGVRSGCSPYKASRSRPLPPEQTKLQAEELHSIRGELSQIKAQVDRLLESLEHMDQHRAQAAGIKDSDKNRVPGKEGCSCRTTETQQELRGWRIHPVADGSEGRTATEQAVQNQASDQEGSQ